MEYKFLLSYILIFISMIILYKEKVGLEKELLISSARAFFQLILLGYILIFILKTRDILELLLIMFIMVLFASYSAGKTVKIYKGYTLSFITILLSSSTVIVTIVLLGLLEPKANQLIPIGGMIIGNALNSYTQTIERFKNDAKNNLDMIESFASLGAPLKECFRIPIKNSIRASLIPIMNNLKTLGIIWIPGITAGMVLSGANPIHAVFFQLVIMFSMVLVAVITSYLATNLNFRYILWES